MSLLGIVAGCEDRHPEPAASNLRERTSASPVPASSSPASPTSDFDFPGVPGWEREEPRALGHEPGFSLGYNLWSSPGPIAVTVFVYKRGLAQIPTGATSPLVVQELNDSLAGIQDLVKQRKTYRAADVRVRDKITLGVGSQAPEVQRVVLDASYFDAPATLSTILLAAAKNHFIKIRVTQPGTAAPAEERALRPVLDAIGRAL